MANFKIFYLTFFIAFLSVDLILQQCVETFFKNFLLPTCNKNVKNTQKLITKLYLAHLVITTYTF